MAPTNAKKEALRLLEAKDAIKKMKLRRREGKQGDARGQAQAKRVQPTVKAVVAAAAAASVSGADSSGSPQRSMVTLRKRGARGVPAKRQSTPRDNVENVESEASAGLNGTRNGHAQGALRPARKSKKSPLLPKTTGIKTEPSVSDSSYGLFAMTPNGARDSIVGMSTRDADEEVHYSPFIRPSGVRRMYGGKKKAGSGSGSFQVTGSPSFQVTRSPSFTEGIKQESNREDEDDIQQESLREDKEDTHQESHGEDGNRAQRQHSKGRKKKIRNPFKISKNSINIKKSSAPMSIKKTSACVRIPSFVSDDEAVICDLRNPHIYRPKEQRTVISGFSVTTVPEPKLPVVKECEESEERSDSDMDEPLVENGAMSPVCPSDNSVECDVEEENVPSKPLFNSSGVQFHFIDGQVILQLKHPSTFTFCGQVQVKVLKGAVEVLGYLLTPTNEYHTVFSPHGSGLLSMDTVPSDEEPAEKKIDWEFTYTVDTLINEGENDDCFLLLKKSENILPFFVGQFIDFKLFPRTRETECENLFSKASQKLQCLCDPPEGSNVIQKGKEWDQISDDIIENPGCTVLCGGKGVGKSTFLRFLVNRLLSNGSDKVLVLDFDPGQAELTLPGCVSLTEVKNPLLGPNFTHLENPLKCIYIGDINVSNSVSRYMDACLTIISHWISNEELRKLPCIVNTMGFTRGIGITIMVQLLSALQPSRVVQILSKISHFNYPEKMSVEYVKKSCSNSPFSINLESTLRTQHQSLSGRGRLDYEIRDISSASDLGQEVHNVKGFDPRRRREAVILSYLSQMVSPPNFSILDVAPYCCPLDTLYLNICHESVPPAVTLSAFNANLVALCCINPADHDVVQLPESGYPSIITKRFLPDCLGFGIVRGIDMETRLLYLLTPIPTSVLTSVNCLVLGAVNLPSLIYFSPPKEPGAVPYVIQNPNKRSFKGNSKCMSFTK